MSPLRRRRAVLPELSVHNPKAVCSGHASDLNSLFKDSADLDPTANLKTPRCTTKVGIGTWRPSQKYQRKRKRQRFDHHHHRHVPICAALRPKQLPTIPHLLPQEMRNQTLDGPGPVKRSGHGNVPNANTRMTRGRSNASSVDNPVGGRSVKWGGNVLRVRSKTLTKNLPSVRLVRHPASSPPV